MVAIDDSASMLWARVIRGMSSIENSVAPDAGERPDCSRRSERVGKPDDRLILPQKSAVHPAPNGPAG